MDTIAETQCSSACDSGWTTYLDESYSYSESLSQLRDRKNARVTETRMEFEEEDLSVVSDASSGPAYCYEDDTAQKHNSEGFRSAYTERQNMKKKSNKGGRQQSYLDDTGSSYERKTSLPDEEAEMERPNDSFSTARFEGKSVQCPRITTNEK